MEGPFSGNAVFGQAPAPPEDEMYEAPRGRLEEALAGIWSEIFRRAPVSRNDDFFGLGGNSLQGMDLMDKVSELLEMELPAVMLFQNPTPQLLAQCIETLQRSEASGAPRNEE